MPAKVLIIDDEPSIRRAFSLLLQEEGLTVTSAAGPGQTEQGGLRYRPA